jgi:hypothetical protein
MSGTYDHQWDRLAKRHLRIHPVCAVTGCGKPAKHVDHVVPVAVAPHRRLDPTNLQGLCHACHNRLTAAYDKGSIAGACDAAGLPLDPSHPWRQSTNAAAIDVANRKPKANPFVAARLKRAAVLHKLAQQPLRFDLPPKDEADAALDKVSEVYQRIARRSGG